MAEHKTTWELEAGSCGMQVPGPGNSQGERASVKVCKGTLDLLLFPVKQVLESRQPGEARGLEAGASWP